MIARLRARPLLRQPGRCTFRQRVGYLHGSIAHRHTGAHNWTTCICATSMWQRFPPPVIGRNAGEPAFRSHSATAAGPQPSREIRYGRVTLRLVCRRSPHRTGPFARSGQAEIRTQLLCSSAASYEAAESGAERGSAGFRPSPAATRSTSATRPRSASGALTPPRIAFPVPRQYPPGQRGSACCPGRAHPGVQRPRLPSGPAGSIGPAIMGRHR